MRTETRTKNTEYKVYIAEDGAEFDSEANCWLHEKSIWHKKVGIVVSKIPKFYMYPNDIDMDTQITFYLVTNHDELEAIKAHAFTDKDAEGWDFETSEFPCWIRVLESGEGLGYIITLEDEIQSALGYAENLRKEKEKVEAAIAGKQMEPQT